MKKFLHLLTASYLSITVHAQIAINTDGTSPHNSAMLDVQSPNKGLLPPRMSWQQIQLISFPAAGLIVYDVGIKALRMYTGSEWIVLSQKETSFSDAPGNFSHILPIGSGSVESYAVAIGSDKSVYIAGSFSGSVSFGGHFIDCTTPNIDIFFARFDSFGNPIWVKHLPGSGPTLYTDAALGLALDGSDNIYLCGYFGQTVDFDPGPGVQNLSPSSSGIEDGFYAKYDYNGNWIWSKQVGGVGTDLVHAIATDGTALYISGSFNATANFNPTILIPFGNKDIFLGRYQCSDGNQSGTGWAIKIGGSLDEIANDIKIHSGNILIGGNFQGTCNFGGSNITSFNNSVDGFFARYNSANGGLLNVHQLGGNDADAVTGVGTDAFAFIYCCGYFTATADFDPAAVVQNRNSAGGRDIFMAKYSSTGQYLIVNTCGGPNNDEAKAMAVDNDGQMFILGKFFGTAGFNGHVISSYQGNEDLFLLKTYSGNPLTNWIHYAGSAGSFDVPYRVAIVPDGKLLFATCKMFALPYLTFDKKKVSLSKFYLARYEE